MVELLRIWQHYTPLSLVCHERSGKLAVETAETLPCELESKAARCRRTRR